MIPESREDTYFMKEAYRQAGLAKEEGEIPVGAVIVADNQIVARAYNHVEKLNDATAHAEMIALTAAFNHFGAKYLTDCTLYVTLEPCVMCAGAIGWSKIKRLVFGAEDTQQGFMRIQADILHPKTTIEKGVMKAECEALISQFFQKLRNRNHDQR